MSKPIVVINFKTYLQGTGEKGLKLAKLCQELGKKHHVDMRVAVQATDLAAIAKAVDIPVYAQHVDPAVPGRTTGQITPQAIKQAGAAGTLLNHSEHLLATSTVKETTNNLIKTHLEILVCADSLTRLRELDQVVHPTFFVIEPPELIAGDVSVQVAQPDVVRNAVQATRRPVLVGAGVSDYNDLHVALELGAQGVLLSSHILTAKDPRRALMKLLTAHGR